MVIDGSKLNIEEAKKRKGKLGMSDENFENLIKEKQDELFTDIRSLIFQWKEQKDGSKKLMSRLPNGKITFLDRHDDPEEMETETPYMCAVYEPQELDGDPGKVAFAKVICPVYKPIIYVIPSHMVTVVYKDKSGKTRREMPGPQYEGYEEKMMYCVKKCEDLGFPEVVIKFRANRSREVI